MSQYSALGQFLKNVDSLNLQANRWAALLPTEKTTLQEIAEPLGVTAALALAELEVDPLGVRRGSDWDFSFRHEWAGFEVSEGTHLTAEREVSFRHWPAGAQVQGFKVGVPFSMAYQGAVATEVGIGRDGDHAHPDARPGGVGVQSPPQLAVPVRQRPQGQTLPRRSTLQHTSRTDYLPGLRRRTPTPRRRHDDRDLTVPKHQGTDARPSCAAGERTDTA